MAKQYDEKLIIDYVENDISDRHREKVVALMEADPQLKELIEEMINDRITLQNIPDPSTPDWIMEEVDRNLERAMLVEENHVEVEEVVVQQKHVLRRLAFGTGVAAMIALLSGVVVWSLWGIDPYGINNVDDNPEIAKGGGNTNPPIVNDNNTNQNPKPDLPDNGTTQNNTNAGGTNTPPKHINDNNKPVDPNPAVVKKDDNDSNLNNKPDKPVMDKNNNTIAQANQNKPPVKVDPDVTTNNQNNPPPKNNSAPAVVAKGASEAPGEAKRKTRKQTPSSLFRNQNSSSSSSSVWKSLSTPLKS